MTRERLDARADVAKVNDAAARPFERDSFHPGVARLDRFMSSTNLDSGPELVEVIDHRLATRPHSTPARRLSSAARARDRVAIARTLRQALAIVLGAGRVRPMMRAQAAGILVFVLVASGVSSVAGLVSVQAAVEVAGTIARDAVAPRQDADSSPPPDRGNAGAIAERVRPQSASKDKKATNSQNRPGRPSRDKKATNTSDRAERPSKRQKEWDREDRLGTTPRTKADDRLELPLRSMKDKVRDNPPETTPRALDDDGSEKPSTKGRKGKNGDRRENSFKDDKDDQDDQKGKKGKNGDRREKSSKDDKDDKKGKKGKKGKNGDKDAEDDEDEEDD